MNRKSPYMSRSTLARARALRREETPAESRLRRALREAMPSAKFRRQTSIGPYFADLISHRCKLIVEVDGSQHGETVEQDAARMRFLEAEGYRVLRFWNNEVLDNLDAVLTVIAAALPKALSPLVGESGEMRHLAHAPGMSLSDTAWVPAKGRRAAKPRTPHPDPLPQGERACSQPPVGVR